jgi:hypothetical protein
VTVDQIKDLAQRDPFRPFAILLDNGENKFSKIFIFLVDNHTRRVR